MEALEIIFVLLKSTATYIYLTDDYIILFIDKFFWSNIALLIFNIEVLGYLSLASTWNLSNKTTELFFFELLICLKRIEITLWYFGQRMKKSQFKKHYKDRYLGGENLIGIVFI